MALQFGPFKAEESHCHLMVGQLVTSQHFKQFSGAKDVKRENTQMLKHGMRMKEASWGGAASHNDVNFYYVHFSGY